MIITSSIIALLVQRGTNLRLKIEAANIIQTGMDCKPSQLKIHKLQKE